MKRRVHVVMGGPSAEHDVSLETGREVLAHLSRDAYDVKAVVISPARDLYVADAVEPFTAPELAAPADSHRFCGPFRPEASRDVWENCDVAFLALHGAFGEDGRFQGYLDTLGVPYTGSGVFAGAVSMDKITSKRLFESAGLTTPPYTVYRKGRAPLDEIGKRHGFPCFVKCPQSGSSKLMGRAENQKELAALAEEFFASAERIMVETAIEGEEFTCAVLRDEQGETVALPPIEIRPVHGSFFDYRAKYVPSACEELVPAPRPQELLHRIETTAVVAHDLLSCRGVSRTDMLHREGTLYVLETNTLPGLTSNSLVPKAFRARGGTYPELLDLLIREALRERQ